MGDFREKNDKKKNHPLLLKKKRLAKEKMTQKRLRFIKTSILKIEN